MNPAQINAGVVMSSQMFGIVEIHVGAVCNLPLPNSNTHEDAAAVRRAIGLP